MLHGGQRGHGLAAHPLRGAVGRHQIGMRLFEQSQLIEQLVVVAVADLRLRLGIVSAVVVPDLLPQALNLLGCRRAHGLSPLDSAADN